MISVGPFQFFKSNKGGGKERKRTLHTNNITTIAFLLHRSISVPSSTAPVLCALRLPRHTPSIEQPEPVTSGFSFPL